MNWGFNFIPQMKRLPAIWFWQGGLENVQMETAAADSIKLELKE